MLVSPGWVDGLSWGVLVPGEAAAGYEDGAVLAEEGVADAHAGAARERSDLGGLFGSHVLGLHAGECLVFVLAVQEHDGLVRVGEGVARDVLGGEEGLARVLGLGVEDAVGGHAASKQGGAPHTLW